MLEPFGHKTHQSLKPLTGLTERFTQVAPSRFHKPFAFATARKAFQQHKRFTFDSGQKTVSTIFE
jgi:hypothetical protein